MTDASDRIFIRGAWLNLTHQAAATSWAALESPTLDGEARDRAVERAERDQAAFEAAEGRFWDAIMAASDAESDEAMGQLSTLMAHDEKGAQIDRSEWQKAAE